MIVGKALKPRNELKTKSRCGSLFGTLPKSSTNEPKFKLFLLLMVTYADGHIKTHRRERN